MLRLPLAVALAGLVCVSLTARADDSVNSLVGQLKPRVAGAPIVTRGIRPVTAPGTAATVTSEPTQAALPPQSPARSAPSRTVHASVSPAVPASPEGGADRPSADINIQFATGSAEFTPAAIRELDILGQALTDPQMGNSQFLIEGHTDTVGDKELNRELSERRAAAVVIYLVTKFHLPAERLTAKGLGEDGLLVPTPDNTAEARNRRVHVVNLSG
jgi:OmpA-OmpF porin, OOP family